MIIETKQQWKTAKEQFYYQKDKAFAGNNNRSKEETTKEAIQYLRHLQQWLKTYISTFI